MRLGSGFYMYTHTFVCARGTHTCVGMHAHTYIHTPTFKDIVKGWAIDEFIVE